MVESTTTLTIQPTAEDPYPNQYIGNNNYTNNGGDVINDKVGDVFTVPVTTGPTSMITTIDVMLGY